MALEMPALLGRAWLARTGLDDIDLAAHLTWEERQRVDRDAPLPAGRAERPVARDRLPRRRHRSVSVELQELFGLAETPCAGPRQEPILLVLLAPNGRPVQSTRDLRSFWKRTYPEVRKELRGRYPKHPWPENPWTATATARTKRRG